MVEEVGFLDFGFNLATVMETSNADLGLKSCFDFSQQFVQVCFCISFHEVNSVDSLFQ
jgi:hypothetical protein